jgi:hypothetical protein
MAAKQKPKELPIPARATESEQAAEVLRAWIIDGQLHIAAQRTFEKPEMWANMLLDFAKHAAVIYEQQGVMTQRDALMRITGAMSRHLGGAGGMDSGQTTIL